MYVQNSFIMRDQFNESNGGPADYWSLKDLE